MNIRKLFLFAFWTGCCLTSTLYAQERAKPKNGEGVSTFLFNVLATLPVQPKKEFLEINKGKLTRDGGLILGS